MQFFFLACASAPTPAEPVDPETVLVAADAGVLRVRRELVFEVGELVDGEWTPRGADGITTPTDAELAWGRTTLRVERMCGPVIVPLSVGAGAQVVVPVPACVAPDAPGLPSGVRLERRERGWGDLVALATLGVVEVATPEPGEESTPARFVDHAQAGAVCAFFGGRLPTAGEWAEAGGRGADRHGDGPSAPGDPGYVPAVGPYGHEALDGNVAEWLNAPEAAARAEVAGGSWLRAEVSRSLPKVAREEDVGFRCVFRAAP